jgi:hypothetical protein
MQTSPGNGATTRMVESFSLRKILPDRLQTLLRGRAQTDVVARSVEPIKELQRDALRYLTSHQDASRLGDYLDCASRDRASRRGMTQVLKELRLDDVRVFSFDSNATPAQRQKSRLRKASVVLIGCDRHEATADVLRFVEPLIVDQTVIIFDGGNFEQKDALDEFLRAHPGLSARSLSANRTASSWVLTRALTV